jgi:hypothetical protein
MKTLHDGAAIYMFAAVDCVMRGNYAHDITDTGGYGASSYYLDERSTNCIVEQNISINVVRPSHNHMATNNIIRQNVFINKGDLTLTLPRSTGFTFDQNVFYATGKIRIEGINNIHQWGTNIFYSQMDKFESVQLKEYGTISTDDKTPPEVIRENPQFINPDQLDFNYSPTSPATRFGIPALSAHQTGRQITR